MKSNRKQTFAGLAFLFLAGGIQGLLQAGETNTISNANFDSSTIGWSWETWSAAGSGVSWDGTQNAAGGAVGSGSLKLTNNFSASVSGYQQAVYTLAQAFDASAVSGLNLQSMSFDLQVDGARSTPRAGGDYGGLTVVLRYGASWTWEQQNEVILDSNSTTWRRYTIPITGDQAHLADIRAITLKVAENDELGPVVLNIDNISFNDEFIIDSFDSTDVSGWQDTYGSIPVLSFSTHDYYGRTNTSGALEVAGEDFVAGGNNGGWQQAVVVKNFAAPITNMSAYTAVNVDVLVTPDSAITSGGNYGFFEIKNPADGSSLGGVNLTSTTAWTHVSFPISSSLTTLNGIIMQLGSGAFVNPVKYLADNLTFSVRRGAVPPPSLSLAKSTATGLRMTGSSQYQRQNILAISPDATATWWISNTAPVTYSFNIASSPADPNLQMDLFLSPNSGNAPSLDYNDPNVILLDIRHNADGSGGATFTYKTNEPNGNDMLYHQNNWASNPVDPRTSLHAPTAIGTWSLKFQNDTNVTLSGPGGVSTNFNMLAEHAAFFDPTAGGTMLTPSMTASFGIQPNAASAFGEAVIYNHFQLTSGSTNVLEDFFNTAPLDTTLWRISAGDASQINIFQETGWLLRWTIPDSNFYLQGSSNVNNSWYYLDVPYTTAGTFREALIVPTNLPSADRSFFRLVNTNSP